MQECRFNKTDGYSIWNYDTGKKKAQQNKELFKKNLTRESTTDTSYTKFYGTYVAVQGKPFEFEFGEG